VFHQLRTYLLFEQLIKKIESASLESSNSSIVGVATKVEILLKEPNYQSQQIISSLAAL